MFKISRLEFGKDIQKNLSVFILNIIAFVCAIVMVGLTMNYYILSKESEIEYRNLYEEKSFFKVRVQGNIGEIHQNIFSDDTIINVKNAFEQLRSEKLLKYHYSVPNPINFGVPPMYKHEFLEGFEEGREDMQNDSPSLKAIYADRIFFDTPAVRLSEGKRFTSSDYIVTDSDQIELPAILGSEYRDLYAIGDVIPKAYLGTDKSMTLKVIGFLENGSYYSDNNNQKMLLNRYIIVPAVEIGYNYMLKDGSFDRFFIAAYDEMKIINARIVCRENDSEKVKNRVNEIFVKNKLYEFSLFDESGGAKRDLKENRQFVFVNLLTTLLIAGISLLMMGTQVYNKLMRDRKKYAIYIMCGTSRRQIYFLAILNTLFVFCFADLFALFIYLYLKHSGTSPGIFNCATFGIVLGLEFVVFAYVWWFTKKKIHASNLSGTLRQKE